MQIPYSQTVAKNSVASILKSFQQSIHLKKLVNNLPQFTHTYVSKISGEYAYLDNYPQPPIPNHLYQQQVFLEDRQAVPLKPDQFSSYLVKTSSINEFDVSLIQKIKDDEERGQNGSRFRKTASTRKASSYSKRKKIIEPQNFDKYFIVPPNLHTSIDKLPEKALSKEESDLQIQLQAMQFRLYERRRIQQEKEQKERQRLAQIQAIRRRNRQNMPKSDFTFSFEGRFMRKKKIDHESFNTQQLLINHSSEDLKLGDNDKNGTEYSESERGRSNLMSRFKKAETFNNFNKRQVSHLPFLKVSDNAIFKEYGKSNEGSKTERLSLRKYTQKNEDKSFRHHHQIEKERREKELNQILRKRYEEMQQQQKQQNPENSQLQTQQNTTRRRQSYMLNRYFKKLRDQNIEPSRKSMNFSPTNFPKNSPIHNFYKHNFDKQRTFFESEMISKVLDN